MRIILSSFMLFLGCDKKDKKNATMAYKEGNLVVEKYSEHPFRLIKPL